MLRMFKITAAAGKDLLKPAYLVVEGDSPDKHTDDITAQFHALHYFCAGGDADLQLMAKQYKDTFGTAAQNLMSPPNHDAIHHLWDAQYKADTGHAIDTQTDHTHMNHHWHNNIDYKKGAAPVRMLQKWLQLLSQDKFGTLLKTVK